MTNIPSYVAGPFFLLLFFGLSVCITLGAKNLISYIKERFFTKINKPVRLTGEEPQKAAPHAERKLPEKLSSPIRRKRKAVRTIEIDPDNVDRIYVRKSG